MKDQSTKNSREEEFSLSHMPRVGIYTKEIMISTKNSILSNKEINHKIKRIAYQIYESNLNDDEVILAGIDSNGYILAKKLKSNLTPRFIIKTKKLVVMEMLFVSVFIL